jgi:hypothetical protein
MRLHRLSLMILAAAMCFTEAKAEVVNGNFETGDLTGWNVVEVYHVSPPSLSYVHVEPGSGAGATYGAEIFAHCGGGGVVPSADPFAETRLNTTFWYDGAGPIEFDYHSYTGGFDGGGGTVYVGVSGPDLANLFSIPTQSEWTTFSFDPFAGQIHEPGEYTFSFIASTVRNPQDEMSSGSASLYIDNVRVAPEPSTFVLLAIAAIGLFAWRRRLAA